MGAQFRAEAPAVGAVEGGKRREGHSVKRSWLNARWFVSSLDSQPPRFYPLDSHSMTICISKMQDEARMRSGEDPRTTLMIHNIPNKYTVKRMMSMFAHLVRKPFSYLYKNRIETSASCPQFKNHPKLFDFFYLPMDMKSKCNVGYAFVNIRSQSKAN